MPAQAVMGDMCLITGTHCHAPCHPAGTAPPVPAPGPATPQPLVLLFAPTVMVCNMPALTVGSMTPPTPCHVAPSTPCVPPIGVGKVKQGSGSVKIMGKDAARVGDPTEHKPCDSGAVPSSGGTIKGPGAATVMTGG